MSLGVALVLLALGVVAWPVPSASDRRLARLRVAARVAVGVAAPAVTRSVGADRARSWALLAVAGAVVVAGLSGGPPLAVAAGSAVGSVAVVVLAVRRARLDEMRRRDLATALAVLRGELDAGLPFADALRSARARAGEAVAAFDLTATDDPDADRPDVVGSTRRSLTAGAGLVAVAGVPWSAVAAGVARDVAAHHARDREVAAALAGARASTVVLAGLPVLGLGLAAALGADPVSFLLSGPTGRWVLAAGTTLDLLGVVVSSALASRAAR